MGNSQSSILFYPGFMLWRGHSFAHQSKIRKLDRGQIVFVFSVERIVTLRLAFSATLDAVPRPPYKACYHSLSRLKDAYTKAPQ